MSREKEFATPGEAWGFTIEFEVIVVFEGHEWDGLG